jgi:hypothetical protein
LWTSQCEGRKSRQTPKPKSSLRKTTSIASIDQHHIPLPLASDSLTLWSCSELTMAPNRKRYLIEPVSSNSSTPRAGRSDSAEDGPDDLEPGYRGCGFLTTTNTDGSVDSQFALLCSASRLVRDRTADDRLLPHSFHRAAHHEYDFVLHRSRSVKERLCRPFECRLSQTSQDIRRPSLSLSHPVTLGLSRTEYFDSLPSDSKRAQRSSHIRKGTSQRHLHSAFTAPFAFSLVPIVGPLDERDPLQRLDTSYKVRLSLRWRRHRHTLYRQK